MGEGGEWELQVKEKAVETAFSMHIGTYFAGQLQSATFLAAKRSATKSQFTTFQNSLM